MKKRILILGLIVILSACNQPELQELPPTPEAQPTPTLTPNIEETECQNGNYIVKFEAQDCTLDPNNVNAQPEDKIGNVIITYRLPEGGSLFELTQSTLYSDSWDSFVDYNPKYTGATMPRISDSVYKFETQFQTETCIEYWACMKTQLEAFVEPSAG